MILETFEISEFPGFPPDLASAKDSRTKNPSCVLVKSLDGASSSCEAPPNIVAPPDIVVLYHTFVADGGLSAGYEK